MIAVGQHYTFTTAAGNVCEYVIDEVISAPGLDLLAKLRNVETGGIGWATNKWLNEGERPPAQGYFTKAAKKS